MLSQVMIEQQGMVRLEIRMRLQCNELLDRRDHRFPMFLLENRMSRMEMEEEETRRDMEVGRTLTLLAMTTMCRRNSNSEERTIPRVITD